MRISNFSKFYKLILLDNIKYIKKYLVILCNMKKRISATIDKETEKLIKKILEEGPYRNKSHVIEEAIKFFKRKNDK